MKKLLKNFFLILIKSTFYRKCSLQYLNRFDVRLLLLMGFFQRVLGINRKCSWPVHWSALVGCPENIERTGETSSPGRMPGQYIQAINGISFGSNIRMAPGVKIISANHDLK